MSNTIVFGVNPDLDPAGAYECEVLTTISTSDGHPIARAAGHVMLSFPSGGKILTSCGHWVELVKLDVSEEAMMRVAQDYGVDFYSELQSDMVSAQPHATRTTGPCTNANQCWIRRAPRLGRRSKSGCKPGAAAWSSNRLRAR